jgi:hypothetical protein
MHGYRTMSNVSVGYEVYILEKQAGFRLVYVLATLSFFHGTYIQL